MSTQRTVCYLVGALVGEVVALSEWNYTQSIHTLHNTRHVIAEDNTGYLYDVSVDRLGQVQSSTLLSALTVRSGCCADFLLKGACVIPQNTETKEDFRRWSDSIVTDWNNQTILNTYKEHSLIMRLYKDIFKQPK